MAFFAAIKVLGFINEVERHAKRQKILREYQRFVGFSARQLGQGIDQFGRSIRVELVGGKDFQRDLRAVGRDLERETRVADSRAADLVASKTRSSYASRSGVAAKVAPSVASTRGAGAASVRIGGAAYPFTFGAEHGSARFRQFEPYRGRQGYSLWPTVRRTGEERVEEYGRAVDRAARRAFPG